MKKLSLLFICFLFSMTFLKARESLTIYSGRSEKLVGKILKMFEKKSGIELKIRYGKTAQLAALLSEESTRTPADVFFSQDVGALAALAEQKLFSPIPTEFSEMVHPRFFSKQSLWIGITGRARVVDYNKKKVKPSDLPNTIWGFLDKKWAQGKIGWAPLSASLHAFVAGLLITQGEERTREWIRGIKRNQPRVYPKNSSIVAALGRGEVEVGFVNNYYLYRFLKTDSSFPVAHHHTTGDVGSMINIAGIGILNTSKNKKLVYKLIRFLLSRKTQTYFAKKTFEYPLRKGVSVRGGQKSLSKIPLPDMDLNDLKVIRKGVNILKEEGIL